jgi:hypothetical protein
LEYLLAYPAVGIVAEGLSVLGLLGAEDAVLIDELLVVDDAD